MPWFGWFCLALLFLVLLGVIFWPLERLRNSDDVMQGVHGDQPRLPQ